MEDSHKKFILEIFEKFIFLRSISAFIFYLLFGGGALVRAYFGDVSFSFTQENLVFIGYAFMIIPISAFFGWLIDKRIQKQKEAERQEQEELEEKKQKEKETKERERQEQEQEEKQNLVKNLNGPQFYVIEKMLNDDENVFNITYHDEYSKFQVGKKLFLELKRKKIGAYTTNEIFEEYYYIYTISFRVHSDVWEILMELYINNPELFDRPDE